MIGKQGKPLEDCKPVEECKHLEALAVVQTRVIKRHIQKHMYYKGMDNPNQAIADFIENYLWIVREVFCDLCYDSKRCMAYQDYLKNDPEIDHSQQT